MASTFGQAPSVHADNNPGLGNTLEVEVEALTGHVCVIFRNFRGEFFAFFFNFVIVVINFFSLHIFSLIVIRRHILGEF